MSKREVKEGRSCKDTYETGDGCKKERGSPHLTLHPLCQMWRPDPNNPLNRIDA
jgi:hypothetical protein